MTPEEIQQVRERCEKASPGPWEADITDRGDLLVQMDDNHSVYIGNMEGSCHYCHGNQEFIAASRSDVPALLAHIASLEARNEAMEGVVAAARRLIDADTVYEERRPLIDALAALDAQAGEVT